MFLSDCELNKMKFKVVLFSKASYYESVYENTRRHFVRALGLE